MDLFVLNQSYETVAIIDAYESLIWTDRYNAYGDFELYLPMDVSLLAYLQIDNYLWMKESEHTMIIEDISIDTDVESGNHLTVTGRSLESILTRRVVWQFQNLNGNFQEKIEYILNQNIISSSNTQRQIEGFTFVASEDSAITELTIDCQLMGEEIYSVIQEYCELYNIGFKLILTGDNKLEFSFYTGTDRSFAQTENPYVVFSPGFDNIINSNYYASASSYKNVALIEDEESENYYRISNHRVIVGDESGINRRETYVSTRITGVDDDGTTALTDEERRSQLREIGNQTLAENTAVTAFEGEVEYTTPFTYGTDFFVGDTVQIQNEYGIEGSACITEVVFSVDESGSSVYPTFATIE